MTMADIKGDNLTTQFLNLGVPKGLFVGPVITVIGMPT
jgi:hypothetical protein